MNIKDLHKKLLKIMDEIHKVSLKSNIEYSLEAGSALGAFREKGFIPWDDDMDIIVELKDYDKFSKELEANKNIKVVDGLNHKGNRLMFTRVYIDDIYIDVVPYVFTSKKNSLYLDLVAKIKWFKGIKTSKKTHPNSIERIGFKILKPILHVFPDRLLRKLLKSKMHKLGKKTGDNYFPFWNILLKGVSKRNIKGMNTEKKLTKFENREYFCFKDVKPYLEFYYGKDYMKPKKSNFLVDDKSI